MENIDAGRGAEAIKARIEKALAKEHKENAWDIAFHLSDWSADAAFIVALHLFPERFTDEQLREGVLAFVVHAPNHVPKAGELAGYPVEDIFSETE